MFNKNDITLTKKISATKVIRVNEFCNKKTQELYSLKTIYVGENDSRLYKQINELRPYLE